MGIEVTVKSRLMRTIKYIVVHCTATPQTATIAAIQRYWKDHLGWKSPGYHYIIEPSGNVVQLHPEEKPSNGVKGYNSNAVHLSYIGGVNSFNMPQDNRTQAQKDSMLRLIKELKFRYPMAVIQGHHDFPGVKKACPSFDAKKEYATL